MAKTEWERFWEKVDVQPNDGCWLWKASLNTGGYGQFFPSTIPRRNVRAHRYAYEHFVGPIPEGLELDHLCRVRHCVNPVHLEPVTRQVNVVRGVGPAQSSARLRGLTHCKRGHELGGDNIWIRPSDGARVCKACTYINKHKYRADPAKLVHIRAMDAEHARAARERKKGAPLAVPNAEKTHCPHGHPLEGDNLHVDSNGARRCLTCRRAASNRAYEKRKGRLGDGV